MEENREKLLGKDHGLDQPKLNIGQIQDSNERPKEVVSIRDQLHQRLAGRRELGSALAAGYHTSTHGYEGNEKGGNKPYFHDTTNEDIALFMFICMLVGQFMKIFAGWTGIPYTCLITVFGFVMGAFQPQMTYRMSKSLLIWG